MRIETLTLASITTGFLLVKDIGLLYKGIEQFVHYSPFTHQLPRLSKEITPWVLKHVPGFPTEEDAKHVTRENVGQFCADLIDRWGAEVEVPPMVAEPPRDPIAELIEMRGGKSDGIIPVVVGEKTDSAYITIQRPMTEDFAALDAKIEARMGELGYKCVDAGAGLGFRDQGFVPKDAGAHFPDETATDVWEQVRKDVIAMGRFEDGDVECFGRRREV